MNYYLCIIYVCIYSDSVGIGFSGSGLMDIFCLNLPTQEAAPWYAWWPVHAIIVNIGSA